MSIEVNIPHFLHDSTKGKKVIRVKGNTVGECFKHLVERFPAIEKELFDEHGELLDYLGIFINEDIAYPEELSKPVKDGDKIHIVPIIAGG